MSASAQLIDETSIRLPHPSVEGATQVAPTQDSFAYEGNRLWDEVQTLQQDYSNNALVTLVAPPSTQLTDLSQSYIEIEGYYNVPANNQCIGGTWWQDQRKGLGICKTDSALTQQCLGLIVNGAVRGANYTLWEGANEVLAIGDLFEIVQLSTPVTYNNGTDTLTHLTPDTKEGAFETFDVDPAQVLRARGAIVRVTSLTSHVDAGNTIRYGIGGLEFVTSTSPWNNYGVVLARGQGYVNTEPLYLVRLNAMNTGDAALAELQSGQLMYALQGGFSKDVCIQAGYTFSPFVSGVTVPTFFGPSLFRDVTLDFNGTTVVQSQGNAQPYCAMADVIKNEPASEKENAIVSRGVSLGHPALARDYYMASLPDLTLDAGAEGKVLGGKNGFSLVYRFSDIGMRTNGHLLPANTQMRVQFRIQPSNITYYRHFDDISTGDTGIADTYLAGAPFAPGDWSSGELANTQLPNLQFGKIKMMVARKELKPERILELQATTRPFKLEFQRVVSYVEFLQPTARNVSIINALGGQTPTSVYAFVTSTAALQGTDQTGYAGIFTSEMYQFNIQNAYLQLGGSRYYPLQPYSQDIPFPTDGDCFTRQKDIAQVYQMYRSTCDPHPFLSSNDFAKLQPLCFQISNRSMGTHDEVVDTSLQFKMNLTTEPNFQWAVVLVAFRDGVIEFDKDSRVSVANEQ